jgi:hypothetical protein
LFLWKIIVYFVENNISQKHIKMENKKAVKLTDFQKNEENPFMKQAIEGIENHVVKKYKSNSGGDKRAVVALADTETGEVFKTSFIRQIEVDEEQFTKLYLSNFAAFFDLSQAAIRVFGYFMTCMVVSCLITITPSRMGAALACIFCPTVSRYLCFALSSRWEMLSPTQLSFK